MKSIKKIVLSILAGAAIALGGIIFLLIKSLNTSNWMSILASYSFSIGLILVLIFGLWLFTGKIGYVFEKKFTFFDFIIMFFGNFVGAIVIGYLAYFIFKNTGLYEINFVTTVTKLNDFNFGDLLLSGILCGMFVYAAVESFKIKKLNIAVRIFLVVAFIGTFVALKLNHCIANMFYISFSNTWSWKALLFILVNTLANSIGAIALNFSKQIILTLFDR
ncbi:MAG: formate/nitrite transporter family protein [Erysipelotrichales bacterium]|nr:formate/nitrite transporter family protein [Erysipelotrichales bacterium]